MGHDFKEFKQAGNVVQDWLKKEFALIHTGRAMPSIHDSVKVKVYDSFMTISQVASVSVEDPKTLRVVPWDKEVTKQIDQAIRESNLGLSVSVDAAGLRVFFPVLTSERRTLLTKIVKEKLEAARIKIRTEREKSHSDFERKEKEGLLSKDDKFRLRTELQKLVDETNLKLDELASKKEREILE